MKKQLNFWKIVSVFVTTIISIFIIANPVIFSSSLDTYFSEQFGTITYPKYKILTTGCSDNRCVSVCLVDSKYFNQSDLKKLAKHFSKKFKDKTTINVNIFDDKELAESYSKGIKEARELQFDRRGWYFRTEKDEVLIFRPDKSNPDKFETINLKNQIIQTK